MSRHNREPVGTTTNESKASFLPGSVRLPVIVLSILMLSSIGSTAWCRARVIDKDTIAMSVADVRTLKDIYDASEEKWKTIYDALLSERKTTDELLRAKDDYIKTLEDLGRPRDENRQALYLIVYGGTERWKDEWQERIGVKVEWKLKLSR